MNSKKYCVIDLNKKFIEALDRDTDNRDTVYTVPPNVSEYVDAFWQEPEWKLVRDLKRQKAERQKGQLVPEVDLLLSKLGEFSEETYEMIKNKTCKKHVKYFERRMVQFDQAICFYFEKGKIPKEFKGHKKELDKALQSSKDQTVELIFSTEPEGMPDPSDITKLNLSGISEDDFDTNYIPVTEQVFRDQLEKKIDMSAMYPNLPEFVFNYPLELNTYVQYILDLEQK